MKYIRLYESKLSKNIKHLESGYWLVPTDSRFEKALKKIGVPKDYMQVLLELDSHEYIYVGYAPWTGDPWGWMPYEEDGRDYFKDNLHYEFQGLVDMDEDEIEIMLATRKYNL